MPKIYIAGPMSGKTNNNEKTFFKKEKELILAGWEVVNPARLDKELLANVSPDRYTYEGCARRDIAALKGCVAIYMLSEWEESKGACWERALAEFWGIKRYYEVPRADRLEVPNISPITKDIARNQTHNHNKELQC